MVAIGAVICEILLNKKINFNQPIQRDNIKSVKAKDTGYKKLLK
jgi:hypothetical protein